jgi:O-antigen/teichoic acid export membrane protein
MLGKIRELKARLLSDPLVKGIVIIASGTAIAQVIGIITMPVITRLYSPADFGALGLFMAALSLLAIGGGLRYELAFPLPKEDRDAANLFMVFLLILSVTTILLVITIFLFGDFILSYFHIESLQASWIFLVIGFFGISLYGGLTSWVSRCREYTRITYTKIYQSVGGSVSKVIFGILSWSAIGLLLGYLLSQILGVGTLVRYMWENDRSSFSEISWRRMLENAKRYFQFPLFSFPSSIVNNLALQLPTFMLTAIYGLSVVGMYSLASSVLVISSSLISTSMNQVYYAEVTSMMRENSREIKKLYIATTRKLFLVGLPLILIPSLLAPVLFPIIFGAAWQDAGFYCLPLAICALSNFVISPTSMLSGYGFNHWSLIWDVARTALVIISFFLIQLYSLPVMSALLIYSCTMAFMYGVSYLMNLRALDIYLEKGSGRF